MILVRDVFQQHHMLELKGNVGIGHVRYPTAGCDSASEAQPFYVNAPYGICIAHNGNLTNATELAEVIIREDRRHLNTTSDSEAPTPHSYRCRRVQLIDWRQQRQPEA